MHTRGIKKYQVAKAVLLGAALIFGLSAIIMLLWNWLIPTLFRGSTISLWQALGLLVLTKVLFGGWSRRRGSQPGGCRSWKKNFEEKWNKMPPEEQARFKQSFANRCHRWRWSEPEPESESKEQGTESGRVKVG